MSYRSRALIRSIAALSIAVAFLSPVVRAGELPGVYHAWNDTDLGGVATLNGNVTVSLPQNQISATVDGNGNLKSLSGSIEIHGAMTADVEASLAGAFSTEVPLAFLPLPIIPVNATTYILPMIGLLGTVSGNVEVGARMALMEQFKASIDLSFDKTGVHASVLQAPERTHRFAPPEATGSTHVSLDVGIIAGVSFQIIINGFPIGGPTVVAAFGLDIDVDPLANPWWDVHGTLDISSSYLGAGFVLFTIPLHSETIDIADAGGPLGILPLASRWSRTYSLGDNEDVTSVLPLADGFLVTGNGKGVSNRCYLGKLGLDGVPVWEKRAQVIPTNSLRPVAVVTATNGDILLGGYTLTSGGGRIDRLDSFGNPLWNKILAGPAPSLLQVHSMIAGANDSVIVAGEVTHIGPNQPRPIVAQLDSTGAVAWAKEFDPGAASPNGRFRKVIATRDGGLLLVGTMTYEDAPYPNATLAQPNFLVVKLDANQLVQFTTVIGTTLWDEAFCACEGADGTFVIGGQTPSWVAPNVHAAMLVALDSAGGLKWSKVYAGETISGSSGDTPYDFINGIVAIDGGYVISGNTGLPSAVRDCWLFGLDWDGVTTFFKSFRTDERDEFAGVVPVAGSGEVGASGFLAYGFSAKLDTHFPKQNDFWLARTQVDGYLDFDAQYGFDCVNDKHDWGHAHSIVALPMPGTLIDLTLTTSNGNQGFDIVATTSTRITP